MLDTSCSEVVWRVLATHSIRQFPLHFPSRASPCAITFQLESSKGTNLNFSEKTSWTLSQRSTRRGEDNKMVDFPERGSEGRLEIVLSWNVSLVTGLGNRSQILRTASKFVVTLNSSAKKCTYWNTIHNKYPNISYFGNRVSFSRSLWTMVHKSDMLIYVLNRPHRND